MKKIIYIIFFSILFLALSINILSLFDTSFFGIKVYKIGSGSMEPYLKINDVIIIKSSTKYKLGDIITFKSNDEYITHRIVSINNNEIITKGDANNTNDEAITNDMIVGKLVYKFKVFGFISVLLSKPLTWILLFIIGFIITYLIPDSKNKNSVTN